MDYLALVLGPFAMLASLAGVVLIAWGALSGAEWMYIHALRIWRKFFGMCA